MKYCEDYAALLDLFVDGELPRDEMERVRAHLADCPGCRAYVDDALVIRAGFPDVEDTPVPEGFVEGVMDRIRAVGAESEKVVELKRRSARRWVGTAAALAACCALVVLVQTGPGGAGGLKAATDTAAPSGYDGGEEAGVAPQMAAADAAEPEESPQNYASRSTQLTTAGGAQKAEEQQRSVLAAAPSMEAAAEDSANAAAAYEEIALCLTAEEAGDLLDEFTPEQEDGSERRYTLSQEQYEALLEALGRWEKLPEAPEMNFQVVVTGPFK